MLTYKENGGGGGGVKHRFLKNFILKFLAIPSLRLSLEMYSTI